MIFPPPPSFLSDPFHIFLSCNRASQPFFSPSSCLLLKHRLMFFVSAPGLRCLVGLEGGALPGTPASVEVAIGCGDSPTH